MIKINNYNYEINNNNIFSSENLKELSYFMEIHKIEKIKNAKNFFNDSYLISKLISLCIKKGKKKMAYKQIFFAFKLIKQFFRFNPIFFLKNAILQIEPFIFLHKIPRGKKIFIYPRILPVKTRINNTLNIIVAHAFKLRKQFRFFYISLAFSILEHCFFYHKYNKKIKEDIETAELNKRNMKRRKKEKGKPLITKIKRRERFKLFKKIKAWK